ncbi:MAG: hypothetical protein KKD44_15135 [Proteobacteria bacterium]|nr:hypothetical protein [Pseudomonadota bacterium]
MITLSHRPLNTQTRLSPRAALFLIILFISTLAATGVWAAAPALQWDNNSDADYYVVYWRTTSESTPSEHSAPIPAGTLSFPLSASPDGKEYFYSVKAFNACGNSSDFSDEIKTAHLPYGSVDIPSVLSLEIILPEAGTLLQEDTPAEFSANIYNNESLIVTDDVTWNSSIDGQIGTGSDISARLSSGLHTIMATTDDNQGNIGVDTLLVTVEAPNTLPDIAIQSSGGLTSPQGQTYTFTGQANDIEDGDLSETILWRSNLAGRLGSGQSIQVSLTPGAHTITAIVTDKDNGSREASMSVVAMAYNAPPAMTILDAKGGTATEQGQPYTLTGQALDAEDGDLSPTIVWLSDLDGGIGSGATVQVTLSQGHHTITARVADSKETLGEDSLPLYVAPWNAPPSLSILSAKDGALGIGGQEYCLTGSAKDTEDGDLSAAIIWTSSKDGKIGVGSNITVTLSPGEHILTALITDSQGKSAEARITVVTGVYNAAPEISISSASPGALGTQGQAYAFTGLASDTEDGDLSSNIVWTSNKDGQLGTGKQIRVTLSPGEHSVTAAISDSQGKNALTRMPLTVETFNTAPVIAITSSIPGVLGPEGKNYTLLASASDVEEGDLSSKTVWTSNKDGQLGTGKQIQVTLSPGEHMLTATVTDSQGKTAETTMTLSVGSYNNAPEIAIMSSTPGASGPEGQVYTFKGSATDAEDGDLSSTISWSSNVNGVLGTGATMTVTLSAGVHSILAQVCDTGGKTQNASKEIAIEAYDAPPVITILPVVEKAQDDSGQTCELSAKADDNEDGNISARISWTSNLQGALGSGATLQTHLCPGTHALIASVKDSGNNRAEASLSISIQALNKPPVLTPMGAVKGAATVNGQTYTFSSNATDPEEGDLSSSIQWSSTAQGDIGTGPEITTLIPYGQHTIIARVSDSQGTVCEITKDLNLVWVNQNPVVRILSAQAGAAGTQGQVYTFTGSATDMEDGDLGSRIVWTSSLDGQIGEGTNIWVTLSEGTHTITARVSDQSGGNSLARTSIRVESFNVPPTLEILGAMGGEINSQGQVFEFSGKAADPEDGDLSSLILWRSDRDGDIGQGAFITVELSPGTHTIYATVTDRQGKDVSKSMTLSAVHDSQLEVQVSSRSFYYFNIVTITWSGGTSDVSLFKNDRRIGSGGPEGSRHYWSSGAGEYKVCEIDGGRCSESRSAK